MQEAVTIYLSFTDQKGLTKVLSATGVTFHLSKQYIEG